jgi:hypothetical protein
MFLDRNSSSGSSKNRRINTSTSVRNPGQIAVVRSRLRPTSPGQPAESSQRLREMDRGGSHWCIGAYGDGMPSEVRNLHRPDLGEYAQRIPRQTGRLRPQVWPTSCARRSLSVKCVGIGFSRALTERIAQRFHWYASAIAPPRGSDNCLWKRARAGRVNTATAIFHVRFTKWAAGGERSERSVDAPEQAHALCIGRRRRVRPAEAGDPSRGEGAKSPTDSVSERADSAVESCLRAMKAAQHWPASMPQTGTGTGARATPGWNRATARTAVGVAHAPVPL